MNDLNELSAPGALGNRKPDLRHVRAPLLIGIAGHRDLREEDREKLTWAIRDIFLKLKEQYSSTPLVLLSSLAEGSDRLAARVALSSEILASLFVPLPMPQVIYEQDFDRDSRQEFRELLGQACKKVELPLVDANTIDAIKLNGYARDLQYESVGKYIAQKSQILIALWDGAETGLTGGTASIVRFQLEGLPEMSSIQPPEGFPVYQIITPHLKNLSPKGAVFHRKDLYPPTFKGNEEKAKEYYSRMFFRIDEFNQIAMHPDDDLCKRIKKCKKNLLEKWPEEAVPEELRVELDRYGLADALAIRLQVMKVRATRWMHCLIFLAFLLFILFAHLTQNFLLLAAALLLVCMVSPSKKIILGNHEETKFEDYRAMAEGLRVRFFWRLVGLPDSVTDHYLGMQRTELDWIRNGLRGWDIFSDSTRIGSVSDLKRRIELTREHWVANQKKYFKGASEREEKHFSKIERHGKALIFLAVSVGSIVMLAALYQSWPRLLHFEFFVDYRFEWKDLPVMLMDICLAGAALLHNYAKGMAYREHAKQYDRMEGIFSTAAKNLKNIDEPAEALAYIKGLGKEALGENGNWVLLHRERPLEVPHP